MKTNKVKLKCFLLAVVMVCSVFVHYIPVNATSYSDTNQKSYPKDDCVVYHDETSYDVSPELILLSKEDFTDCSYYTAVGSTEIIPLFFVSTYLDAEYTIDIKAEDVILNSDPKLYFQDNENDFIVEIEFIHDSFGCIDIEIEAWIEDESVDSNVLTIYTLTTDGISYVSIGNKTSLLGVMINSQYEKGELTTSEYIDSMLEAGMGFDKEELDKLYLASDYEKFCFNNSNLLGIDFSLEHYTSMINGDYSSETVQEFLLNKYNCQSTGVRAETFDNIFLESPVVPSSAHNVTVHGRLTWKDTGNPTTTYHEFKNAEVIVTVEYGIKILFVDHTKTVTKKVYTDSQGYYSATFDISDVTSSFYYSQLIINLKNDKLQVNSDVFSTYALSSSIRASLTYNTSTLLDYSVSNNTDAGKAVQIYQAAYMAHRYANIRQPDYQVLSTLKIIYPYTGNYGSHYNTLNNNIYLIPEAYHNWDTIQHEFGHYVDDMLSIATVVFGDTAHVANANLIDYHDYTKDKSIKLAWSEGFATYFAMSVQQFYRYDYNNIVYTTGDPNFYVGDFRYNQSGYNIKDGLLLGEANEVAVASFLLNLSDGVSAADNDYVYWGYQFVWDLLVNNNSKTLSEFVAKLAAIDYNGDKFEVGKLLTKLNVSSIPISKYETFVDLDESDRDFRWQAGGGSNKQPNNNFVVVFYNVHKEVIWRSDTEGVHIMRYNDAPGFELQHHIVLSDYHWHRIRNLAHGDVLYWNVETKNNNSPITGVYLSDYNVILDSKVEFITVPLNNERYTERMAYIAPGSYKDYLVTFSRSGNRVIQTFGANDAFKDGYLEIYNMSGIKLAGDSSTDDKGYGRNALISYYFSANTQYRIRVKFYYPSHYGAVKLAITPTNEPAYDSIYYLKDYTMGLTWQFYQYNTNLLVYEYSTTRTLTMRVTSSVDAYLYIIDPRSTYPVKPTTGSPSVYNDDYNGLNPQITRTFEAGVRYLVIVSAYNPANSNSVGSFYVDFG